MNLNTLRLSFASIKNFSLKNNCTPLTDIIGTKSHILYKVCLLYKKYNQQSTFAYLCVLITYLIENIEKQLIYIMFHSFKRQSL